eukprot:snap_masked-scaffold313_size211302-processed-gene-1.10 protein:Tk07299 transcript:snap_masked-scaffold313_size211302-processed-gene-1.10-mRNA-1 annotation:"hypothetical protein DAPPUDRAFT_224791"
MGDEKADYEMLITDVLAQTRCGLVPSEIFLRKGERKQLIFWTDQNYENLTASLVDGETTEPNEGVDTFLEAVNGGMPMKPPATNETENYPQFTGSQATTDDGNTNLTGFETTTYPTTEASITTMNTVETTLTDEDTTVQDTTTEFTPPEATTLVPDTTTLTLQAEETIPEQSTEAISIQRPSAVVTQPPDTEDEVVQILFASTIKVEEITTTEADIPTTEADIPTTEADITTTEADVTTTEAEMTTTDTATTTLTYENDETTQQDTAADDSKETTILPPATTTRSTDVDLVDKIPDDIQYDDSEDGSELDSNSATTTIMPPVTTDTSDQAGIDDEITDDIQEDDPEGGSELDTSSVTTTILPSTSTDGTDQVDIVDETSDDIQDDDSEDGADLELNTDTPTILPATTTMTSDQVDVVNDIADEIQDDDPEDGADLEPDTATTTILPATTTAASDQVDISNEIAEDIQDDDSTGVLDEFPILSTTESSSTTDRNPTSSTATSEPLTTAETQSETTIKENADSTASTEAIQTNMELSQQQEAGIESTTLESAEEPTTQSEMEPTSSNTSTLGQIDSTTNVAIEVATTVTPQIEATEDEEILDDDSDVDYSENNDNSLLVTSTEETEEATTTTENVSEVTANEDASEVATTTESVQITVIPTVETTTVVLEEDTTSKIAATTTSTDILDDDSDSSMESTTTGMNEGATSTVAMSTSEDLQETTARPTAGPTTNNPSDDEDIQFDDPEDVEDLNQTTTEADMETSTTGDQAVVGQDENLNEVENAFQTTTEGFLEASTASDQISNDDSEIQFDDPQDFEDLTQATTKAPMETTTNNDQGENDAGKNQLNAHENIEESQTTTESPMENSTTNYQSGLEDGVNQVDVQENIEDVSPTTMEPLVETSTTGDPVKIDKDETQFDDPEDIEDESEGNSEAPGMTSTVMTPNEDNETTEMETNPTTDSAPTDIIGTTDEDNETTANNNEDITSTQVPTTTDSLIPIDALKASIQESLLEEDINSSVTSLDQNQTNGALPEGELGNIVASILTSINEEAANLLNATSDGTVHSEFVIEIHENTVNKTQEFQILLQPQDITNATSEDHISASQLDFVDLDQLDTPTESMLSVAETETTPATDSINVNQVAEIQYDDESEDIERTMVFIVPDDESSLSLSIPSVQVPDVVTKNLSQVDAGDSDVFAPVTQPLVKHTPVDNKNHIFQETAPGAPLKLDTLEFEAVKFEFSKTTTGSPLADLLEFFQAINIPEVAALEADSNVEFDQTTTGSPLDIVPELVFEAIQAEEVQGLFDETTTGSHHDLLIFAPIEAETSDDSQQIFDKTTTGAPLLKSANVTNGNKTALDQLGDLVLENIGANPSLEVGNGELNEANPIVDDDLEKKTRKEDEDAIYAINNLQDLAPYKPRINVSDPGSLLTSILDGILSSNPRTPPKAPQLRIPSRRTTVKPLVIDRLDQANDSPDDEGFPVGNLLSGIYRLVSSYITPRPTVEPLVTDLDYSSEEFTTPLPMRMNVHNAPRDQIEDRIDNQYSNTDPFVQLQAPDLRKPDDASEKQVLFPVPFPKEAVSTFSPFNSPALRIQDAPRYQGPQNTDRAPTAGPLSISAPADPVPNSQRVFYPGNYLRGGSHQEDQNNAQHSHLSLANNQRTRDPVSIPLPTELINEGNDYSGPEFNTPQQPDREFDAIDSIRQGDANFYRFINAQPLPIQRGILNPANRDQRSRRQLDQDDDTTTPSTEPINCNWSIKTEPGLYLLVTFHNLSAPFTVDCQGAYIEVERENNGFEARWCGNRVTQGGSRPHVIFAKNEVRISVYDDGSLGKELPTGFSADVEVIDLYDGEQYSNLSRTNAYSNPVVAIAGCQMQGSGKPHILAINIEPFLDEDLAGKEVSGSGRVMETREFVVVPLCHIHPSTLNQELDDFHVGLRTSNEEWCAAIVPAGTGRGSGVKQLLDDHRFSRPSRDVDGLVAIQIGECHIGVAFDEEQRRGVICIPVLLIR